MKESKKKGASFAEHLVWNRINKETSNMADEIDKVIDELKRQNFTVEKRASNHYMVRAPPPATGLATFARSRAPRALANTLRDLLKIGFKWPPPREKSDAGGVSSKAEICCTSCASLGDATVCAMPSCACHKPEPVVRIVETPKPVLALLPPSPIVEPTDLDSLHLAVSEARATLKSAKEYVAICDDAMKKATADWERARTEENAARHAFLTAKTKYDAAIAEDVGETA